MRCSVLIVLLVGCGAAAGAATSCAQSEQFFARHNASADDSREPGSLCGGNCCGRGRELRLRSSLKRAAEARVFADTRPLAELLLSTRRTQQQHLMALSYQSQNKTSVLFAQVYRGHASKAHGPLNSLYEDIRALLKSDPDRDLSGEDLGSPPPRNLVDSAKRFFRDVFPVAYHKVLALEGKQFTTDYEGCLKVAYETVQPFGDVPQKLGDSLSKSLEVARALLQVLALGAGALAASERVLASASDECSNKLLDASGCQHCRGITARPCKNYCLNVARGCIGSLVAELDAPWAGYVEGVERLARPDADNALRELEAKVSEAILHALENQVILENKVRQECGPPSTIDVPELNSPRASPGTMRRDPLRTPPSDAELLLFAANLAEKKKLFATLADKVCEDPDFSHDGNDMCWNGESVGEYTKPLVPSASLSNQRYNPEVTSSTPDMRVATLGDKLRQVRQMLVSHSWGVNTPVAEAFMQGDEAGDEGSGSGRPNYSDDDAAYDSEGSGDEGSGVPDISSGKSYSGVDDKTYSAGTPPHTDAATTSQPAFVLTLVTVLAVYVSSFT